MSSFSRELHAMLSELLGLDVESYTSLTTVEDETCFVTKDGGQMSLITVHGHRRIVGLQERETLCRQLTTLLGSGLAGLYHTIDLCFHSDPDATSSEIDQILEPSRRTAERQGLDLDDIFAERVRHLPRYTASESAFLVVWTSPYGLPRTVRRQAKQQRRRQIRKDQLPGGFTRENQNPYAVNDYLVDTHRSFVRTILADMTTFGFDIELLNVNQACFAIRHLIDPEWTGANWQPTLPGMMPPLRQNNDGSFDTGSCWMPAMGAQLIPRDIRYGDYRTVQVGDRLYQPIYVDYPQLTEAQTFDKLFDRIRRQRLPWRITIRLDGNAAAWLLMKKSISGLLFFAGHQNKLISKSVTALRKYINEGGIVVRGQMSFTSWVNTTQPVSNQRSYQEELRSRTAQLASYVQAWGTCTVREYNGHPPKAFVSTVPGLSRINIATKYGAPMDDILQTLPVFRPASPWRSGSVIFRSRDGKLYPYLPGSAEQGVWNSLYFARPGSGKSVTMNANNLGLALSPGLRKLPFIRIIDIGPSSEGFISLLQEALEPRERHQAQFHRISNDKRWAANPLDTQLGLRHPMPQERAFLVSFLSVLATKPGDTSPAEGVADMIGLVLDLAYDHFSEAEAPKRYSPEQDRVVDAALKAHAVSLPSTPSWWDVVDTLFDHDDAENAIRAQRYAVPLLSDLVSMAQVPQVHDMYGDMRLFGTGETPIQLFNRVISAATREFPILAYPTRFDLGNARVASLDIANICGDLNPVGQRSTAIAYMLARHILGRDLFIDETIIDRSPERYQPLHQRRFEDNLAYPKKFCMDEKHRCGPITAVNGQIVRDMREGRKNNVQVDLASQILDDFTDEMVELSSSLYIMEYGNDDMAEDVREKFSLPQSGMDLLRIYGNGPTKDGAPFLSAMKTKHGMVCQLLYLTNGPIEMWALNTTAEDRVIRRRLYGTFGPRLARAALARVYPGGSAKAEIERRLDLSEDPDIDKEKIIAQLVAEVGATAQAMRLEAGAPASEPPFAEAV